MTIQTEYQTDTTYKLGQDTFNVSLYPGEYGFVVHEITGEEWAERSTNDKVCFK